MIENSMFEIIVTEMKEQEWQGWVSFPESGEKYPFQSILELLDIVERNVPSAEERQYRVLK